MKINVRQIVDGDTIAVKVLEDGALVHCNHGTWYTQLHIDNYMQAGEHCQNEYEVLVCGGCDRMSRDILYEESQRVG